MGIISVEHMDHLYWLGRYSERVYTTIHLFADSYDRMIDVSVGDYADLCRRLDIRPEEVLAFGDDRNDADMIRFAGIGVAMENAIEELRAAADWVAVSNAEAGVARGIERFVLGE